MHVATMSASLKTRQVITNPDGSTTVVERITYPSKKNGKSNGGTSRKFEDSNNNFHDLRDDDCTVTYDPEHDHDQHREIPGVSDHGNPPRTVSVSSDDKTFEALRDHCLQEDALYEDPDFAISSKALEWRRPIELSSDPHMFVGGASRFDIKQGKLGDCWLLAAIASLSQYPDMFKKVVPQDQGFSRKHGYCGMFHFYFWSFGQWKEVIIDDRLPTRNGKLVFLRSSDPNEFWTPLFEKAYAKLKGSYENLAGGRSSEAMEDFTGGVTEEFKLTEAVSERLYHIMKDSMTRGSLLGCSIDTGSKAIEAELASGLIVGHAYSVTGAAEVKTKTSTEPVKLVRVRNPWGDDHEWKGAWSDRAKDWENVSESDRRNLNIEISDDGEFWMSFKDFTTNFTDLEICHVSPEAMAKEDDDTCSDVPRKKSSLRWEMSVHQGSWKKKSTAGGCRNFLQTYWINPQYGMTVTEPDDTGEAAASGCGTVIIALLQEDRRRSHQHLLTIGYSIYKRKDDNSGPMDMQFFKRHKAADKCKSYADGREICGRHKLAPGSYCIVPSTFEPNQEGEFLLRVYTKKPIISKEIDEVSEIKEMAPDSVPTPTEYDKLVEDGMLELFKKVAGRDDKIDAEELQNLLNTEFQKEIRFDGFSSSTCRSLVSLYDLDYTGTIEFDEFKKMWTSLRQWKTVFKQNCEDDAKINSFQLRHVLRSIGMSVSNATFNSLVQRYSRRDGEIQFDDYIHCIARLCTMFDIFKTVSGGESTAKFTLDQFISTTMYA